MRIENTLNGDEPWKYPILVYPEVFQCTNKINRDNKKRHPFVGTWSLAHKYHVNSVYTRRRTPNERSPLIFTLCVNWMIFRNRYRLREPRNLNSLVITFRLCCCFFASFQLYVCQNWKIVLIKYLLIVATNDYNNNTWCLISITRIHSSKISTLENHLNHIHNLHRYTHICIVKRTIFLYHHRCKKVRSKIRFIETCKIQVMQFLEEAKEFPTSRWHIEPNQLIQFSIQKKANWWW